MPLFTQTVSGDRCGCYGGRGRFVAQQCIRRGYLDKNDCAFDAVARQSVLHVQSVIRVNQIESTRADGIGNDEAALHTPEAAQLFREAFGKDGRRSDDVGLQLAGAARPTENYKALRERIVEFHGKYGTRSRSFRRLFREYVQLARASEQGLARRAATGVGDGGRRYRPKSVVAGFLAADNLRYLAEQEGIHVCQGNIWSQYAIDNGDGEGSISYPYYPSKEHFCKPAQGRDDFIDCVNLDGWTCDFVTARRAGCGKTHNSRMGVGPIETFLNLGPVDGMKQIMATTAAHFGAGFDLNRFAWLTTCWELSLLGDSRPGYHDMQLDCMTRWLTQDPGTLAGEP